jgi:hypothetical protein
MGATMWSEMTAAWPRPSGRTLCSSRKSGCSAASLPPGRAKGRNAATGKCSIVPCATKRLGAARLGVAKSGLGLFILGNLVIRPPRSQGCSSDMNSLSRRFGTYP